MTQTDVEGVILFGFRATGRRDEQSNLNMIIVHDAADGDEEESAVLRVLSIIYPQDSVAEMAEPSVSTTPAGTTPSSTTWRVSTSTPNAGVR